MKKQKGSFYDQSLNTIAPLCCLGMVVAVASIFFEDSEILLWFGTSLFLSGFAVWGFVNGGAGIYGAVKGIKENGLSPFITHPFSSIFLILFSAFFVIIGSFFVWMILAGANETLY